MEEIKKIINGLTPTVATLVNCAFGVLFLVFFLVLPAIGSGWGSVSGAKLVDTSFWGTIVWIVVVLGAVAAGAWPLAKKEVNDQIVKLLAIVYVTYVFSIAAVFAKLGIGSILNIIIVLAPWVIFTHFRKGQPTYLDSVPGNTNSNNTPNTPNIPTK